MQPFLTLALPTDNGPSRPNVPHLSAHSVSRRRTGSTQGRVAGSLCSGTVICRRIRSRSRAVAPIFSVRSRNSLFEYVIRVPLKVAVEARNDGEGI